MDFIQAIKEAKKGKEITRREWVFGKLKLNNSKELVNELDQPIPQTIDNFLADDWEVVVGNKIGYPKGKKKR